MIPAAFVKACLLPVLILVTALGVSAYAQEGATGTITGRVLNAENGKYLSKAQVSIEGTSIEVLTSDYGDFTIRNAPAGAATVRVAYTGQDPVTTPVTVTAGQTTAMPDIKVGRAPQVGADGTVMLEKFQVSADRMRNAQEIAINEERYSVNIKNVVATDQFGDIANGNVGEFVKFLPGVLVSYGSFGGNNQGYSDSDASGVSIRGFGPEDTAILIDGMPVSNAIPGTLTRQVGLDMLAVNNASRVELIKVATPDMPANSPGGQINLITKSAFEYARPTFSSRLFFNFNSENMTLHKTPGPTNKDTYKVTPGVELSASYPISANLGVTFTGFWNREFNQTSRAEVTQTYTGSVSNAAGPVSLSNPLVSRLRLTDTPRTTEKTSGNIKVDWRPTPAQLVTGNVQYSTYESVEAQRRLDVRPTIATGANWGPDFTQGTTANSTVDMTVTTRDKVGDTKSGYLKYSYRFGGWDVAAYGSYSVSEGEFKDRDNGHYSEIALKLNPGQVNLRGIQEGIPSSIETFRRTSNGGGPLDYTSLANYSFDGTTAKSGAANSRNKIGLYKVDVSRQLDFIPYLGRNSLVFSTGFRRDQEKSEKWGLGTGFREILGPGKSYIVADILDQDYIGQSVGFGLPAQQWASTYRLFALNQQNQLFVEPTDGADAVGNWQSYVGQQKSMTVTTDGYYGQLAGKFLKNRLSFLGGVRQEEKTNEGLGPWNDPKWNYAKLPNGLLYLEPSHPTYKTGVRLDQSAFLTDTALQSRMRAAGVVFPDHVLGASNTSLESAKLNRIPNRYVNTKVKNDPSYSLSASYEITKNLQFKAAWSRSLKQPPLEDNTYGLLTGGNQFSINENTTIPEDGTRGNIVVANPGLKAERSNNLDFELTYYTDHGSKLSVSYYTKKVDGGIQNFSTYSDSPVFGAVLPTLGLDPEDYDGWRLTTSSNGTGSQKTSGWEFDVRQDFAFLGGWGKHFQAFATYTMKNLGEPSAVEPFSVTTPAGTQIIVTPTRRTMTLSSDRFASAGIMFQARKFSATLRGNWRNDNEQGNNRVTLADGNFLRRIEPAETRIDVSADYRLNRHVSFFVSGRDVFNAEREIIIRDDFGLLPGYAERYDLRRFGVQWQVGVRATF